MSRRALLLFAMVTAGACSADQEAAAPRRHVVEISGFAYQPASLAVAAGDTVVWVNRDLVPHTATAADGTWDSGSISGNQEGKLVISRVVRGEYVCAFHPNMRGRITVQ